MNYTILRNNTQFVVDLGNLRSSDLVLAQNGYFYPVYSFKELRKYFPSLTTHDFSEFLNGVSEVALIAFGIIGVATLIDDLLQPRYNNKPLTQGIRNFIHERDEEICFYCDIYVPNGHVDHRVSRANGGSIRHTSFSVPRMKIHFLTKV